MNKTTATTTNPFTGLKTERLLLRRFSPAEAPILHGYRIEKDVARYQSWDTSYSLESAKSLVASQQDLTFGTPDNWYQIAIIRQEDSAIVGDCALHIDGDDPRLGEVGFTLSKKYQGFGYAREATEAIITFVFEHLNMHRLRAITDAENTAAHTLLTRMGFRKEGHFVERVFYKGSWGSECEFAMLKKDWQTR